MTNRKYENQIEVMRIEIQKLKSGVEGQLPPNLISDLEKYQG